MKRNHNAFYESRLRRARIQPTLDKLAGAVCLLILVLIAVFLR